jgi:hypothetical protein
LSLAAAEFDVFVTVDRNLSKQHDLSQFNIAVVVLIARSNRLSDLLPLIRQLLSTLNTAGLVKSRKLVDALKLAPFIADNGA